MKINLEISHHVSADLVGCALVLTNEKYQLGLMDKDILIIRKLFVSSSTELIFQYFSCVILF